MKHVVGVADMKCSNGAEDVIVTHALGSCLGLTAYDPVARVGAMLHVMMPASQINPDKAQGNPCMFVDTGVPVLFHTLYAQGAQKQRIVLKVAGGANVQGGSEDRFAIGKRNLMMLKKVLWKNGVLINAEDTGGHVARTMYLEIASGRVWLSTAGQEREL